MRTLLPLLTPTLVLLFAGPVVSQQQTRTGSLSERWFEGFLVLNDGDTLRGKVNFNTETEALRVNAGGTVRTYSSQGVRSFRVFDDQMLQTRRFQTLPFVLRDNYERPTLFEVLAEGKPLQLYAQERTVMTTEPVYDPFLNRSFMMQRPRLERTFFFRRNDGRIRRFLGRKRDLYLLLEDHKRRVRHFVKRNNLRLDRPEDLVEIVNYYNQLHTSG
ncbi:MAG: hypothetical protein WBA12_13245 [Catalinimonas sp.]